MKSPKSSPCFPQFTLDANKNNNPDHFIVEDLLDFSNDDAIIIDTTFDSVPGNSTNSSSTITIVENCNSSSFYGSVPNTSESHLSGDLCVPCDDIAELEWLSNLVEESFSSEDLQKMQLISGINTTRNDDVSEARDMFQVEPAKNNLIFNSEVSIPAKARSKRSRGPPCNWASRLLVLSSTTSSSDPEDSNANSTEPAKKPAKAKKIARDSGSDGNGDDGRRCLHCATDKTPQWRTGPMGPKTLCNACGVRFKSGRLVPEYRPAASPTFVLTKHSNSHRKVLELRRQKEMVRAQEHRDQHFLDHHHHRNIMFDISNGGDNYLIHQNMEPHVRQLI